RWWLLVVEAGVVGRKGPDYGSELARMHPFGPPDVGVPMTVSPDPGCSVRSRAVLQAHAQTRARPVVAFSDDSGGTSSCLRMWKQRASSRRAMATVAMLVPRRRASSP